MDPIKEIFSVFFFASIGKGKKPSLDRVIVYMVLP